MTSQHHHHPSSIHKKSNMNRPSQEKTKAKNRKFLNRPEFTKKAKKTTAKRRSTTPKHERTK